MVTLMDLGKEIIKIREAIDSVEIRGVDQIRKNAPYLTYAYDKCTSLIQSINQIVNDLQKPQNNQNGVNEGSEMNGEPN